MTAPARFRQSDLKRAAQGLADAGLEVVKVEIDPSGKIVLFTGNSRESPEPNEWADLEP